MTDNELSQVNETCHGTLYLDEDATLEVNKTTAKKPLLESPFLCYLHIGANKEGYWNSNHIAIQMEDTIEYLKMLYPNCDYVILVDHSNRNDKMRKGVLDVVSMNTGYGGTHPTVRDSTIATTETCYKDKRMNSLQQQCL